MAQLIHVVGLGVETGGQLTRPAEEAVHEAEVIIGAQRQLDWLLGFEGYQSCRAKLQLLPKLSQLQALIGRYAGQIVILASGDPLHFGIGRWLGERYPVSQLRYYSAVSSIQAACARLGLAQQECQVVSLHGRPLSSLKRYLQPGRRLIVLTDQHSHPGALARLCVEAGLGESRLWVCARLGYPDEQVQGFQVGEMDDFAPSSVDALQVSVLELRGSGGVYPSFPGLDDRLLLTDGGPGQGMITKREVRIQILSLLQANENQVLWDVGAGCGGVSTEIALWHPGLQIHAIEPVPERLACLRANKEQFGCSNLWPVDGRAPAALADWPDPDRIFIGGSDGALNTLLAQCWSRLRAGGVLVASAVTEPSYAILAAFAERHTAFNSQLLTLTVSRREYQQGQGQEEGQGKGQGEGQWQVIDKRPVTLLRLEKAEGGP